MQILFVAKPWRGGLARYLLSALDERFPGQVKWIPTTPIGSTERLHYLRDRRGWRLRLRDRIANAHPDVALFINHRPEFDELPHRDENLIWLTDDPRVVAERLNAYGRVFISDPGYAADMRRSAVGSRFAGVLPFAHLPTIHHPVQAHHRRRNLCFIGNRDIKRDITLECLLRDKIPITIYGNYFMRSRLYWRHPSSFRPSINNDSMGRAYSAYHASLNVHAAVVRGGTNMRTFEAAGYGIPQLVEYRPGLELLFEPERELLVFHDAEELKEQAKRLLRDPALAARLAANSRDRALAEHRYQHRIERVFATV